MSTKAQGKVKTRNRSFARDLTAKTTARLTVGGITYNGHAGLGANAALGGTSTREIGANGVVTDNKDPDKRY